MCGQGCLCMVDILKDQLLSITSWFMSHTSHWFTLLQTPWQVSTKKTALKSNNELFLNCENTYDSLGTEGICTIH